MRELAAHDAGIGFHCERFEAAPLEDSRVSLVHFAIALLRRLVGGIETISVFHDEFFGAHEPEARTDFIPEFGLNLVKVLGHLAIGIDLAGNQRRDHLFMGADSQRLAIGARVHAVRSQVVVIQHGVLDFPVTEIHRPLVRQ